MIRILAFCALGIAFLLGGAQQAQAQPIPNWCDIDHGATVTKLTYETNIVTGDYIRVLVKVNYSSGNQNGKKLRCRFYDEIFDTWTDMYFSAAYPDVLVTDIDVLPNRTGGFSFVAHIQWGDPMYDYLAGGSDICVRAQMVMQNWILDDETYLFNNLPE